MIIAASVDDGARSHVVRVGSTGTTCRQNPIDDYQADDTSRPRTRLPRREAIRRRSSPTKRHRFFSRPGRHGSASSADEVEDHHHRHREHGALSCAVWISQLSSEPQAAVSGIRRLAEAITSPETRGAEGYRVARARRARIVEALDDSACPGCGLRSALAPIKSASARTTIRTTRRRGNDPPFCVFRQLRGGRRSRCG